MNKLGITTAIFWIVLFISACDADLAQNRVAKPEKLISRDTMIKILTEIHLAEAGISMMGIDYNRSIALYQQYHVEILGKHKIDTAQYRQNYEYYMQSTIEMDYILTLVEDSLVRIQAREKQKMGFSANPSATPSYQDVMAGSKSQDTTKKSN
jgi:hypothetical protein